MPGSTCLGLTEAWPEWPILALQEPLGPQSTSVTVRFTTPKDGKGPQIY